MKNIILIAFCIPLLLSAQKEAKIWYFGNQAGIDFNGATPVPLTDGLLNTAEGCASIADKNGNLLFYTDGSIIWNSVHDTMPNGTGLKGHPSSSQSAIIVPKPASDSIYYVFTVTAMGWSDGLNYSEIDMSLNGGLGDVTAIKNVSLVTPTSEKITAVVHSNGTDIWVIAQALGTNGFYAYLVTSGGVNTSPVISNAGMVIPITSPMFQGILKASPDGKYLAMASQTLNAQLFKFDNLTGSVTTPTIPLVIPLGFYGLEFSPSSQFLYVGELSGLSSVLTQYDLNAPSVLGSRTVIDSTFGDIITTMQIGPDNKIYIANVTDTALGVISDPNLLAPGPIYDPNGFNLGGKLATSGLPAFIQSFFVDPAFSYTNICNNQATLFTNNTPSFDSLLWNFGDPASGGLNIDTSINPTHLFTDTGSFTVTLIAYNGLVSDTSSQIIRILPTVSSTDSINICDGDSIFLQGAFQTFAGTYFDTLFSGSSLGCDSTITTTLTITVLDATITQVGPFCSNDAMLNLTAIDTGGIWTGTGITNTNNGTFEPLFATIGNNLITYAILGICGDLDTMTITVNPLAYNTNTINICAGDSVLLFGIFQTTAGIYNDTLLGLSFLGCDSIISTTLNVNPLADASITPIGPLCSNDAILNLTAIDTGGVWTGTGIINATNGIFDPTVTLSDTNTIVYTIAGLCGDADTFAMVVFRSPTINICCDDIIPFGNSILLSASGNPPFNWTPITWLDNPNSSSPISTPDSTITYYITQTSTDGCTTSDSITIYVINELLVFPNSFTPNNDGLNDEFKVFNSGLKSLEYFKIYNRWGQMVYFSKDLQAGWDGTFNGKEQGIGTYQYEFEAINFDGIVIQQKGTIALIR